MGSNAGALIQLASRGAQDVQLTSQPTFSHFRSSYHRTTHHASFFTDQTVTGEIRWGGRCVVKIDRVGDLLHKCILTAQLTKKGKTNYAAEGLLESVELWIGGTMIDRHTANYFRVYDECFRTEDQRAAYLVQQSPFIKP